MKNQPPPGTASWLEGLLAYFYPPVCQICHEERAAATEGYVCSSCRGKPDNILYVVPPFCHRCGLPFAGCLGESFICTNCREADFHFEWARSAVQMKGIVLTAVHDYKYNNAGWYEDFLAELLIQQAAPELQPKDWDYIVPVPLHPVKERSRGFNQALQLARRLSRATGIPVQGRWLRRVADTRTQTKLSRHEREENVRSAFELRRTVSVQDLRLIVFDDVFTTGATTNACAKVLRKAGAERVIVWTLARGI